MKNIKLIAAAFVFGILATACIDDDSTIAPNSANPYALTSASPLSVWLEGFAQGTDCISITYPVTFLTYTSGFDIDETIVINNDEQLYTFLSGLENFETYAIQYPLTITGFGGDDIIINSNSLFLTTLQQEFEECNAPPCSTDNTMFAQAYNAITGTEDFTMDLWTHEYTFSTVENGTVCSIGYKGETAEIEYTIQILDDQDNILYSGLHSFSDTETEYISINPVTLTAGTQYTIKRSIPSYDVGMGIGTLKMGTAILPYTDEAITIHQARFYGGGGNENPVFNMIPYIDFGFQPAE